MQRVKLGLACLLCLSWAWSVNGQDPIEYDSGVAALQDYSGSATFSGTYFNIRTMTGDGVGYRNGYTQIGATLPIWVSEDMLIAPTARVMVTDNGHVGASGGAMFRKYLDGADRIVGSYIFYDYDESVEGFNYKQWGLGWETLGERWDARANVYLPIDDGNNFVRPLSLDGTPYYVGNNLAFLGVGLFQEALTGADVEIGMPVTPQTPWLRAYAGVYGYQAVQDDPVGFRGRVEAWVSDDLSLAVNVTEDQQFGTNVNAVVDFRFSGWKPTRYFPSWTTQERMLMPVQRNWRVATGYYTDDVNVLACDPATGQPYFIAWIDNSNTEPGDGSFENPYSTLPAQIPGADLILVNRGNTSFFDPLVGSIALFDNQRLLGQGSEHFVQLCADFGGIQLTGGTVALPGFENDGNFPYLSSTGNIITLANGNEVSGFNLVNAGGYAITNVPAKGSFNFDLSYLNVAGNAGGIFLANAGGNGFITDVNLANNAAGGVYLTTGTSDLNLTMTNVSSTSQPAGVQGVGISLNADEGALFATLTDVTASRNQTGIRLTATNSALQAVLDDVTANDNTGTGLDIQGLDSDIAVRLNNVRVNDNGGTGIGAFVTDSSLTLDIDNTTANNNGLDNLNLNLVNTAMLVEIDTSAFNGAGGSGIVIGNNGGGGTVDLDTVLATGNAFDGFVLAGSNFAEVNAIVTRSSFSNNGRNAISLFADTGAELTLDISNVLATNSGQDGFHFESNGNSFITADLSRVTLTNSGRSAIYGLMDNGNADITVFNSDGTQSGSDGLFLAANNTSVATISLVNSNLQNSGQTVDPAAAIQILADNSNVGLQVVGTPLNNSVAGGPQDDGLSVLANNGSVFFANIIGSDMSLNADNAMELIADNGSTLQVNVLRSNGNDSGADGILFQSLNNSLLTVSTEQIDTPSASNFDRSGANGINGYLNNGGVAIFDFLNSSISFSGDNGLLVVADNGSTFQGTFEGGSFINSGQNLNGLGTQDAVHLTAHNGSTVDVALLNTPSGNLLPNVTQQHSLFAVIDSGSTLVFNNTNGDMSNNTINAINVSLAGGSVGTIDLLNTPANTSGEDGFLFTVDASQLFSTVTNGDFSNSGSGGVTGSAINGTLTNGGFAQLNFTNVNSNGAFEHGLVINASGGSAFIGSFDASTFDFAGSLGGLPATAGNAVFLTADNSTIVLDMINGSTGDAAGGDGLVINATNDSAVFATIVDGSFTDEGQFTGFGVGVNVTADDSYVVVDLTNTPTDNNFGNFTQAYGLLFNVTNDADFFFNDTNGSLSNNTLDGINGTIAGAGAAATLSLNSTLVDGNGFNGASFSVTGGGVLNFLIPAVGSISNNGGFGVIATIDGAGSQGNFDFSEVVIDGNGLIFGGDGFNVTGTNGALVDVTFNNGSISSNANQGVDIFINGGSFATYRFFNTLVDNNGNEGLLFEVADDPTALVITSIGASFSGNGSAGAPPDGFDNVNGQITGGFVDALFDSTIADGSTRHGFNFDISDATGPTSVMVQMNNGTSASSNVNGNGVRMVSTGPTTAAHLLMVGDNLFNDNGTAAPVLPAPGLSGSGVYFEADNVLQAVVRFAGSASNNGNVANQLVDQDGVTIDIDTATFAAVEVNGPGLVQGNAQDGIDIRLNAITNLEDRTLFTQTGLETVLALSVSGGIDASSNNGNGLSIDLNNITGTPDVFITGGRFSDNLLNGVNLDLTNSDIGNLVIQDNNLQGDGLLAGDLGFDWFNLIWTTFATNSSTAGLEIARVQFDITPTGQGWRPDLTPFGIGAFQPQGLSDVPVDLVAVDGIAVLNGTNPLLDEFGVVLPTGGVSINSQLLTLDFDDFDPNEQMTYDLAHTLLGQAALQTGGTFTGSTATIVLEDGRSVTGVFTAAGLNINQTLATTSDGITGNGLDGVRIAQNNSDIASVLIDNNVISGNREDGVDFEVVLNSDAGPVTVSNNVINDNREDGISVNDVAPTGGVWDFTVADNISIDGNGRGLNFTMRDGIDLNLRLTDNASISRNAIEGVLVNMGVGGSFNATQIFGNNVSDNGGAGIRVELPTAANMTVNLGDSAQAANTFDNNGDAGVSINMLGTSTGTLVVENSTFSNSVNGPDGNFAGDGLGLLLRDQATLPNLVIGDAAVDNTFFTGNFNHGASIFLDASAQLVNPTVQNITATDNTGDGLNVLRQGSAVVDNFVITDSTFLRNEDGIDISAQFAQLVDEYTITENVSTNNRDTGMTLDAQADAQISALLTSNVFNNNGADGVRVTTAIVSPGDAALVFSPSAWTLNDFSGNGVTSGATGAGLEITGNGLFNLTIGTLAAGNSFTGNAGDGIEINMPGTLNLVNATVTGNNAIGTANGLAGIDINTVVGSNIINVSNSNISNNLGDGVEIDANVGNSTYTFFDNLITFNGRDGVEYAVTGIASASLTINGTNQTTNQISDNGTAGVGGRGVEILVAGGDFVNSTVVINNADIRRNDQEGVYVVLSSDAAQTNANNRDALATAALAANGAVGNEPFLNFSITNSTIADNGQLAGNIGGAGIVMRVGTTGGGINSVTNAGGFAGTVGTGIVANITGNTLFGNFGADALFESFTSTNNPGTTGGTWTDQNENPRGGTADVYNPTGYQTDPLARLDLTFTGNTLEEVDGTRIGAFYNNNEDVFKSRTQGQDNNTDGGADDDGPFGSGTRQRNAQRLAARDVNPFAPGTKINPQLTIFGAGGNSDNFLFPGIGTSTFRTNADANTANTFGAGSGFFFDGTPYDSVFDANGIFNGFGGAAPFFIDFMPYGWSALP